MRMGLKEARQAAADIDARILAADTRVNKIDQRIGAISTAVTAGKRGMTEDETAELAKLRAEKRTQQEFKAVYLEEKAAHAPVLQASEEANEAERRGMSHADPDVEAARRARAAAGLPPIHNVGSSGDPAARAAQGIVGLRSFTELFPSAHLSGGGFASHDEFVDAVASGRHHPNLRPAAADPMHAGDDPHGGFTVPLEFSRRYLDHALESSIVLPRATMWPMTSKTLSIPMFAAHGGSSGPYGVAATWIDESGKTSLTPKQFETEMMKLEAHSLALYVEAANALVSDGMGFAAQLERAMNGSAAWTLDEAFLVSGTGAGQPLAILNSAARVTVSKELGQNAATLTHKNTVDMLARLAPGSFDRSVWIASQTCLPQLLTMSVPVGTGGAFVPAVPSEGGRLTLQTRPLLISEKLPALGTEGDLMLVDLSAYQVGLRMNWVLDTSAHVGFRENKTAFRLIVRIDGQPGLRKPYQPANGSTVSPFVTLQTRA